jgi:nitrite reductase/ring-hydroxylating ferredoxin subunit
MSYIVISSILSGALLFCIIKYNDLFSYFNLIYRLFKKCIKKTNEYVVPKVCAYDYPIPPFPNTWYPICLSSELQKNTLQKKKIAGKEFIIFRDDNNIVSAVKKNCSHMGVDLSYGTVKNNCVVCPFHHHCIKPSTIKNMCEPTNEEQFFIEETNNIIFIWFGESKPLFSIKEMAGEFNCPQGIPRLYKFFTRRVGGHLIDYAEHLLDVNHAPYIHGVHLKPVEDSMILSKFSFTIKFSIEETNVTPVFKYITPTFGVIEYSKDVRIYMMFIVYDVGDIDMIVLPCGNNITELFYSFLGGLYTQIDFADEAAYFSTKNHNIRNLNLSEKPMDDFRSWFIDTYYSKNQLVKFEANKKKYNEINELNNW